MPHRSNCVLEEVHVSMKCCSVVAHIRTDFVLDYHLSFFHMKGDSLGKERVIGIPCDGGDRRKSQSCVDFKSIIRWRETSLKGTEWKKSIRNYGDFFYHWTVVNFSARKWWLRCIVEESIGRFGWRIDGIAYSTIFMGNRREFGGNREKRVVGMRDSREEMEYFALRISHYLMTHTNLFLSDGETDLRQSI